MKKSLIYGLLALVIVGTIFSTGVVSAYRGDYNIQGPNYNEERHTMMEDAFEATDYDSWYDLMTEDGRHPRVVDVVTEDNFETFIQAHEAGINGDYETASSLRAELGLNDGNGPHDGTGYGKIGSKGRGQNRGMQQNNFVDADGDGVCDNLNLGRGRGRN